MSSYIGHHAELYDFFYNDKPYYKEAQFVHDCLLKYSDTKTNKILELACGTGSHACELAKYGYSILATDYSLSMIDVARRKKKEQNLENIEFELQDMRLLQVQNNDYEVVISLFDSVGYVLKNEAILDVFKNVNKSLKTGGLFIFEFWHAAAMIKNFDPVRVRRWEIENMKLLRISETTLDHLNQLATVKYSIYKFFSNGKYEFIEEEQRNRFFQVQEMSSLLTQSGLTPIKWFSGFSNDEHISDNTWHIVAIAQKI